MLVTASASTYPPNPGIPQDTFVTEKQLSATPRAALAYPRTNVLKSDQYPSKPYWGLALNKRAINPGVFPGKIDYESLLKAPLCCLNICIFRQDKCVLSGLLAAN
jgi:hypothetical protein